MTKKIDHYFEIQAMWTYRYISIYDNISDIVYESIMQNVIDFLDIFENNYSRFRENSIISILSKKWTIYDPSEELSQMLDLAKSAEKLSKWYFSIFVANVLSNLWYGRLSNNILNQKIPSINKTLKRNKNEISIKDWWNIDFGWFGKGQAIDKISQNIQKFGAKNFTVNGGGDIYTNNNLTEETMVYFQDPKNMDLAIWQSTVNYWWFASSSPFHRNWTQNLQTHHHLINPKTKKSSDWSLLAVYTYHKTKTVMADIASTVIYICKPHEINAFAKLFEVEYLLILPNYQTIMSDNFPGKLYH